MLMSRSYCLNYTKLGDPALSWYQDIVPDLIDEVLLRTFII